MLMFPEGWLGKTFSHRKNKNQYATVRDLFIKYLYDAGKQGEDLEVDYFTIDVYIDGKIFTHNLSMPCTRFRSEYPRLKE